MDKPIDLTSLVVGIFWEGCWHGVGDPLKLPVSNTAWQVGDGPLSKEGDCEGTGKCGHGRYWVAGAREGRAQEELKKKKVFDM